MGPSRDPFGFSTKKRGQSASPLIVVVQPGQEVKIVAASDDVESSVGSGDSRASPKGSGDSRSSPRGSGDVSQDAFGFRSIRRGFSPSPITLVARSGQEIRIIVSDEAGQTGVQTHGFSGDSRASPKPSGDKR